MTKTSLPELAQLTQSIYWPSDGPRLAKQAISLDTLNRVANDLKKNRALYHVLKENEAVIPSDEKHPLSLALRQGDDHFDRLRKSMVALNDTIGSQSYITFKTFFAYRRLTSDLDIIVHNLREVAVQLEAHNWQGGPIQQGTMDLDQHGALAIGLHERVGWDTPEIFDPDMLWSGLREVDLAGFKTLIPSPEVDIITILAHIPFEKLYIDWAEMCYLYLTARSADLKSVMRQAEKYNWDRSLKKMLRVLNGAHRAAFGVAGPFEAIWPQWSAAELEMPYECSALFAGLSLVEIGAWKKMAGVVFDLYRMSHFFRGRVERKKISV